MELIVVEQMNKYKARLKDISSLEFAENKAKTRLSLIRRSMVRCKMWNPGENGSLPEVLSVHLWCKERLFSRSFSHGTLKRNHFISGYCGCLLFDLLALFSYMYRIYAVKCAEFLNQVFG